MSTITDLLDQVSDASLRSRLQHEISRLTKNKKFGLVFEEHTPERTPLFDIPVRTGSRVSFRGGNVSDVYFVSSIQENNACCINISTGEKSNQIIDDLVVVAEFGEPIYPFLKPLESICNAPSNDLWHTLIEADNYHALQLLEYLYAGKVDCIYIDPPYNTGSKDWKYNNDYVDSSDNYRHSKWLSFIEKRLKLAKKLLNPIDSVLIITIDEKEYLHLGCLLEELFPNANMQMISSVINPSGVSRGSEFYRTDEYIYILRFGKCEVSPLKLSSDWLTAKSTGKDELRWRPIRRQGSHDTREDAKNQFYPIYLTKDGKKIYGTGASLKETEKKEDIKHPENVICIWPLKPNGEEGCWQISQSSFAELQKEGFIKISWTKKFGYTLKYLAAGERKKVLAGQFPIIGHNEDGSIITNDAIDEAPFIPGTQWRISSHSARENGSTLINKFIGKRFTYPKSLYAVRDVLKFFVANKKNALILDFFAGSGTTLHAVNLLNAEDEGKRRCIMVTNNEVSAEEAKKLIDEGKRPGDADWEKLGIAHYVTWPRTKCSILGVDLNNQPIKGNYLDSDEPIANGFNANVAFFKLGFLDRTSVALGRQFKNLLPVLWMKAGCHGQCPNIEGELPPVLVLPECRFAVLIDELAYPEFLEAVKQCSEIQTIFLVTDSEYGYTDMASSLNEFTTYQLYRNYLENFRINRAR